MRRGRLESTWTFIRDGHREVRGMSIRLYTYRELITMLEQAGFGQHQAYGDLDMTPFELGAPWLYLVTTSSSGGRTGPLLENIETALGNHVHDGDARRTTNKGGE